MVSSSTPIRHYILITSFFIVAVPRPLGITCSLHHSSLWQIEEVEGSESAQDGKKVKTEESGMADSEGPASDAAGEKKKKKKKKVKEEGGEAAPATPSVKTDDDDETGPPPEKKKKKKKKVKQYS